MSVPVNSQHVSLAFKIRMFVSPIKNRDFRLVLAAQITSEFGDWAARIALAALVLDRSGSESLSALVWAVSVLPLALFSAPLSYLADRFPRRTVMVVSDLARTVLYLTMIIWHVPVPLLLGLIFVTNLCAPPFTAARSAVLAEALTVDGLFRRAQSLMQTTNQTMIATGSFLGGVLIVTIGSEETLFVSATGFIVSALFVWGIQSGRVSANIARPRQLIGEAWHTVTGDPIVLRAASLPVLGTFGAYGAEVLVVAYSETYLNGQWLALIAALVPIVTALGLFVMEWLDFGPEQGLRVAPVVMLSGNVLALVAIAAPLPPLATAVLVYIGAGIVFAPFVLSVVVVVLRVPDRMRGSVNGLLQTSLMSGVALSAVMASALVAVMSIHSAFGLLFLLSTAYLVYAIIRPVRHSQEES